MYHVTYAQLNPNFTTSRLEALIRELERKNCRVRVDLNEQRLDVEIPDEEMWWVLTGCITIFFEDFKDVASWSFQFGSNQPGWIAA